MRPFRLLLPVLLMLGGCAELPQPSSTTTATVEKKAPVTILISMDAFRPDYLRRGNTPNLDALAAAGVEGTMRPSYPTLTFPNHTALVTGLVPDHSGMVANTFLDPGRPGFKFYNKDVEAMNPFWWGTHEPLWITAEKKGVRSATMFWPGSEVAHGDVRPSDWIRFDANFSGAQRVRTIIDWMRRPAAERPAFVTLYLDATDVVIHKVDIGSPDAIAAIRQVDTDVGTLVKGLQALGQPANLVVVSDHGMREIEPDKTTNLTTLLPASAYVLLSYGPFATIDPVPGHEAEVAAALLKPLPFAQCWHKQDVPPRYRYGANVRVAAIICQAAAGGEVMAGRPTNKSDHGYDPEDPLMTALFIANGPGFRPGTHLRPRFDNVDLYPMLARLIGVPPLANDGNPATLDGILAAR